MIIKGISNKNESCNITNNQMELIKPFDLTKTEICKNFLKGHCKFATNCKYAHGQQELRTKPIVYNSMIRQSYNKGYSNTSARKFGEYHQNPMKRNKISDFHTEMFSSNRDSMNKSNRINLYPQQKYKKNENHFYFTTSYETKANEAIKFAQELIQKDGIESWIFKKEWLIEDSCEIKKESNQNKLQNPLFQESIFSIESNKMKKRENDEVKELSGKNNE